MNEKSKKYTGVYKVRSHGKIRFRVRLIKDNGRPHTFGFYKDEKECAKAYDLYVVRKNLQRRTNFFKKKLAY